MKVNELTQAQFEAIEAAFAKEQRTVLPAGWRCIEAGDNAAMFLGPGALSVITEAEQHDSGLWLHVSVAKNRGKVLPSWEELRLVKDIFIGKARSAIQVLPKESQHYSLCEALHLFVPLGDHFAIPDLRTQEGML